MPEIIKTVPEVSKPTEKMTSKRGKCPNPHEKNVLLTEIIFGNVDDIFQITTKQLDYLQQNNMFEMYGANDIELGDWEMDDETICKHLNISYKGEVKIPLNGPKKVEIKEVVKLLPCSKEGRLYAMDSTYDFFGIPNPFKLGVHKHVCLKRVTQNQTQVTVILGSDFIDHARKVGQRHPFLGIWNSIREKIRQNWMRGFYEARNNQQTSEPPSKFFNEEIQKNIVAVIREVENIPVIRDTMMRVQEIKSTYKFGQYFLLGLVICCGSYFILSQCEKILPGAICPLSMFK